MIYSTVEYDTLVHIVFLAIGIFCGATAFFRIRQEPRRISNGILLVLCAFFTLVGTLRLAFPDEYLPDRQTIYLGAGSTTLYLLFGLLLLVSFIGGIILCVNGVRLIRREGRGLSRTLPILFGCLGILLPPAYIAITAASDSAWEQYPLWLLERLALGVFLYVLWMFAAVLLYALVYATLPKKATCDYILVLGAGLKGGRSVTPLLAGRLDKALQVFRAGGSRATFVLSGGQGPDELVSEAFAMKQYLLEKGIDEDCILLEERSTSTYENMKFSKEMMQAQKKDFSCIIATSNYHVLRAVILARSLGLNAQGVGGRTAAYYLPAAFIREYIAMIFRYKKLLLAYLVAVAVYTVLWRFFIML